MARRYGKVTVTGWIEEDALGRWASMYGTKDNEEAPSRIYTLPSGAYAAEVEFLPEPVVWRDGDAVLLRGSVWGRTDGHWWQLKASPGYFADTDMRAFLREGAAVRLVPEGTMDA